MCIRADGKDGRWTSAAKFNPTLDVIESIAESLIKNASGIKRRLLSKSLQEALLYSVGFDTEIDYSEFKTRFMRYLDRQGPSSFIQRFLTLYFFNFVWFETGESFRALSCTSHSFEKDMEGVERICGRIVASTWKSFEQTHRRLGPPAARKLVQNIEQHLRGV